ncbi:MAG: N-acetylmuramic acid 6-phosphate etherase [Bacteroidota bacterium]|nr:N-acetylmuramic acid 6-phosphate etherase [Bacteroidota bacterium]
MSFRKITEESLAHRDLEHKSVLELLLLINEEDQKVALAVKKCISRIQPFIETLVERMKLGGRLIYIGAGTSGRMGILDASECPPTFGVPSDWVVGLIAGGDEAIRKSVEHAEDSETQAWIDLKRIQVDALDTVIGLAASGTTPYVIHGLKHCQENQIVTSCITNNPGSPIIQFANFPIECEVGPEFISGSTRLKSGTALKLILNMISTVAMIQLGRIKNNKMVNMQLNNEKLIERGVLMIMQETGLERKASKDLLLEMGSVSKVLDFLKKNK